MLRGHTSETAGVEVPDTVDVNLSVLRTWEASRPYVDLEAMCQRCITWNIYRTDT